MRYFISWSPTLSILLFTLLLSGCLGITQPTDDDIKAMAKEHFDQKFADIFSIKEIEKINGYKQNDTHYVAELKITAQALRSLEDHVTALMENESLSAVEKMTRGMQLGFLKITLPPFKANDQITFERNYLLIKTDNGWLLKKELLVEDSAS